MMRTRTIPLYAVVLTSLAVGACESNPFGTSEVQDASFHASVQGSVVAEFSGLGFFTSFDPPTGIPRPAGFTIHSSERSGDRREVQQFFLRKNGADRPSVGRYTIGQLGGDSDFGGTYTRFSGEGSAGYSARSGELEITLSEPDRIEGTFTFTGVQTCSGTANSLSCRIDPNELDDPAAPAVTVTGSFVARPPPPGPIRLR